MTILKYPVPQSDYQGTSVWTLAANDNHLFASTEILITKKELIEIKKKKIGTQWSSDFIN